MKIFGLLLFALAIACLFGAIEALVAMVLWNYVLCAIFTSIPTISFWLAWGILIILNMIGSCFKSRRK
jgi:hypothetical protein